MQLGRYSIGTRKLPGLFYLYIFKICCASRSFTRNTRLNLEFGIKAGVQPMVA